MTLKDLDLLVFSASILHGELADVTDCPALCKALGGLRLAGGMDSPESLPEAPKAGVCSTTPCPDGLIVLALLAAGAI